MPEAFIKPVDGLNSILDLEPQYKSLWEVTLFEGSNESSDFLKSFKYRVKEVNVPFTSLEIEESATRRQVYSKFNNLASISFSVHEDTYWTCLGYFKSWEKSIFDYKRGVFKTGKITPRHLEIKMLKYKGNSLVKTVTFKFYHIKFIKAEDLDLDYEDSEGQITRIEVQPTFYDIIYGDSDGEKLSPNYTIDRRRVSEVRGVTVRTSETNPEFKNS